MNVYRRRHDYRARQALDTAFFLPAGDMAGSAVIAFSEAAAIASIQAIAGSESIAFSEAAQLGGYGSFVGSEAIAFSETGGLDAFSFADGVFTATISFSELAALDGFTSVDGAMSTVIQIATSPPLPAKIDDFGTFVPQPVLPIIPPHIRAIDAKSLADHFNRGQPELPDYEWPSSRKFYQDDSPA